VRKIRDGSSQSRSCGHDEGLCPPSKSEQAEDLAEMPLDGARADEQPACDLGVGQAFAHQPDDLGFLGGELGAGFDVAFAGGLPGGSQLTGGALGESPIALNIS
jgi:hypothetical protein